ncbi:unnamed protein product [Cylindrotheca closterium]|uniref:Hemerythrin-like domain-containing protein n=1 Tax=Cylindrotheca closterium TaxID=2856 RepID=A0AAD2CKU1_9STRA|nr:unnamed protein product [Cylindrotheca closterium]
MLAHNAIRMEIEEMIQALEASKKRGGIQKWEIACVTKAWKTHYLHVHSHHSNKDAMLMPYLETRISYPDKLTSDHKELVTKLDRINAVVESLGQKEEGDSVTELVGAFREYQGLMLPHLKEEEVSRAYFEPPEIGEITQRILASAGAPKVEMGSFIVCQGINGFRNGFMECPIQTMRC